MWPFDTTGEGGDDIDWDALIRKYSDDLYDAPGQAPVDPSKTITNKDGSSYFYDAAGNFLGGVGSKGEVITNSGLNQAWSVVKNLLSGKGNLGTFGQVIGGAGIASLLNKMLGGSGSSGPTGYQGGIPVYTASRTQTPLAEQRPSTTVDGVTTPYRPGQGGITYFTPMQYNYAGKTAASPQDFVPPPAATSAPGGGTQTIPTTPSRNTALASGGIAMLAGGGGRFLQGGGDGVSDSIPATIGGTRPARLADGEFVVDARTVSELGNGSSNAGARKLYEMMDRVHSARRQAERGKPSKADKYLPA